MNIYKDKWWYSTGLILVLAIFSFLFVPAILAAVLYIIQLVKRHKAFTYLKEDDLYNIPIKEKQELMLELDRSIEEKNSVLEDKSSMVQNIIDETEATIRLENKEAIESATLEAKKIIEEANEELHAVVEKTKEYQDNIISLTEEHENLLKEVNRYKNQARKFKSEVTGLKNFTQRFPTLYSF